MREGRWGGELYICSVGLYLREEEAFSGADGVSSESGGSGSYRVGRLEVGREGREEGERGEGEGNTVIIASLIFCLY